MKEYTAVVAIVMVQSGDISLEQCVNRFSKYLDVDIQSDMGYASVILTSLDDNPIESSTHLLLATAARNRNSGQLFSDDATVNGGIAIENRT